MSCMWCRLRSLATCGIGSIQRLISLGLQLYSARAAAGSACAGAPVQRGDFHPSTDTPVRLPLQLASVSWKCLRTPAVLQALHAATSLTRLVSQDLPKFTSMHIGSGLSGYAFSAALGGLTSLKQLTLSCCAGAGLPQQVAEAVSRLSGLTGLDVFLADVA